MKFESVWRSSIRKGRAAKTWYVIAAIAILGFFSFSTYRFVCFFDKQEVIGIRNIALRNDDVDEKGFLSMQNGQITTFYVLDGQNTKIDNEIVFWALSVDSSDDKFSLDNLGNLKCATNSKDSTYVLCVKILILSNTYLESNMTFSVTIV